MKRLFLLLLATFLQLFLIVCIHAQIIGEIEQIAFNRTAVNFTQYDGSLNRYEDRLFSNTFYTIEEYRILEDGTLELLCTFERPQVLGTSIIEDGKFYSFYRLNVDEDYMMIFDVTTTPMTHINTIKLHFIIESGYVTPTVLNEYILVFDGKHFIYKFNKHTQQFENNLYLPTVNTNKDNIFISIWLELDEKGVFLDRIIAFSDYNDISEETPYFTYFQVFNLDTSWGNEINTLRIVNNYLYVPGDGYLRIYDISDTDNIQEIITFYNSLDIIYVDVLFYDIYLVVTHMDGMYIYDISDIDNPILTMEIDSRLSIYPNHQNIYKDKWYINACDSIVAYDLSNNFTKIANKGNYRYDYLIRDGKYLAEDINDASMIKIYSLLEDYPELIQIDTGYEPSGFYLNDFDFDNQELYVVLSSNNTENRLNVYNLESMSLIQEKLIDFTPATIFLTDNFVILSESRWLQGLLPLHRVYARNENLSLQGTFVGSRCIGYEHNDYFFVQNGSRLDIRYLDNPLEIRHTEVNSSFNNGRIQIVNENTLCVVSSGQGRFFTYNSDFTDFSQSHVVNYSNKLLNIHNGFLSANGFQSSTITEFFAIENGVPRKIGEIDLNVNVERSFIFPDEKKLIIWAMSGISVYDISYTTSSKDTTLIRLDMPTLIGNYPNPFNPETTISFTLPNATIASLEIYNIRGQKICGLMSEFLGSGNHQIVWNGTDDNGRNVSSGVYFYRLTTDDFTQTKRMVMMK